MSIPDFQTLMRPLLDLHSDGKEHLNRELVEALTGQFSLSDEARREMLPSGRAKKFDNRDNGPGSNYVLQRSRRVLWVNCGVGKQFEPGPFNCWFIKQQHNSKSTLFKREDQ